MIEDLTRSDASDITEAKAMTLTTLGVILP